MPSYTTASASLVLLLVWLLSACAVSGQSSSSAVTVSSGVRSASTCDSEVVWIEEGPYFVDGQAELSDVRDGVTLGIPLNFSLMVLDGRNTTVDQCVPLANVRIDTWACNWDGVYSDESSEDTLGETWLRGYQLTNDSGEAQFATMYPGWYSGRTPHVHFRLRLYDGTDGALSYDETLQLFFNDSLTDWLYAHIYPYTLHTGRTTYNNDSTVYTLDNQLNITGNWSTGYYTSVMLTIPLGGSASDYILGNATNTGGGGDAGAGSTTTSGNSSSSNGGGGGASASTPSGGGPGSGAGGGPGSSGANAGGAGSSANAGAGSSSASVSTTTVSNSGSSAAAGGGAASSGSSTESSSSTRSAQFSSLAAAVLSSSAAASSSASEVSVSSTATRAAEVYVPRQLLLVMREIVDYIWQLAN